MLFGKKNKEELEEVSKASDRIIMKEMINDDELARDLVLEIRDGNPVLLNFEKLEEADGNKHLAFFIGATVALEGKTVRINDKVFLFARKEDFLDGSLRKFIDSIPRG
ncbi:MAG: cell division protein SepF [Acholeplasmatales bacterium]|nr:cell division protein SepF [Acholeplasmatales bacterium]